MTNESEQLDPGAYIGHEPERAAETIPGGVSGQDERVSAYDSRPGVPGEPEEASEPNANGTLNAQQVSGGQYGSESDGNQSGGRRS